MDRKKVFTSGEVAAICGVSADTVSRWFDLGQIEGYRLGPGGDRRIPYENLKKFMIGHSIPLDRFEEGRRRILVVDDDPYYLDMTTSSLAKLGEYEVAGASTGFDTGAMVVQMNPHMILLDIHIADMDGRMVCRRVKSRPETKTARILALSGYLDDQEAKQLEEYGVDRFLRKPFGVDQLMESVQALFEVPTLKLARPK